MSRYHLSKYFAQGHGHVLQYKNSNTLLLYWAGRIDGTATQVLGTRRYVRKDAEYPSLAALLRGIEAEHADDYKP